MELEWLKKNRLGSVERKRSLIEQDHPELSIRQ